MNQTSPDSGNLWTRRRWLQAAGTLTVGAMCTPALRAEEEPDNPPAAPMQIGILMGTFAHPTLARVAEFLAQAKQLAEE